MARSSYQNLSSIKLGQKKKVTKKVTKKVAPSRSYSPYDESYFIPLSAVSKLVASKPSNRPILRPNYSSK